MRHVATILLVLVTSLQGSAVTVEPANSVIVLASVGIDADAVAAQELQKHLQLVTGFKVPIVAPDDALAGRYPFYVARVPDTDGRPIMSQESRWKIGSQATHLYGDPGGAKTGAQFAVYSFLEDQLGVVWIEPGDEGIAHPKMTTLNLRAGDFSWTPKLMFRKIRQGNARVAKKSPPLGADYREFGTFRPKLEEHNAYAKSVMQWQKRMRMGGVRPGGGHAFHKWWDKYGKSHPEYFALNKFGKREPVPLPKAHQTNEFVKICPSNPKVVAQVVDEWLPRKGRLRFVDTGLNDGVENFCECAACAALDMSRPGEKLHEHLTDRYVHMSNAVAREVRKHREDAWVAMYAYLKTLRAPRKLRLEPNIVVQVVPYVIPLDLGVTEKLLSSWYEAGATKLAFRPNYHFKYLTTCMPIGIEKQMFDVFQIAVKNGCVAADYDSLTNNWPVTGITDYILARAMSEPDRPFAHWEAQYCSAFGAAADDVRRYFRYWRTSLWEQRLMPKIHTICSKGGAGDFARGLLWSIGDYYTVDDFVQTHDLLETGLSKELTAPQRQRVVELLLANKHAELMFRAISASPMDKSQNAAALLAFRKKHRADLDLQWMGVFAFEVSNGDLTGFKIAKEMQNYLKPWLQTELFWRFKLDPDDQGLREGWQRKSWKETADWERFRTDRFWERQFNFDETNTLAEATARVIGDYNGIAWYKQRHAVPPDWRGRKIYLRFGAVDESCWVYVNGKAAGEHLYKRKNDWKTPFEIPIDTLIDWQEQEQVITVRVEDKSGVGGIWRPVWIVSRQ